MAFLRFMASSTGRIVRMVAGAVLMVVGWLVVGGTAGLVVVAVGLIPLAAGFFDICLFGPLFGRTFSGTEIRSGNRPAGDL
jgi:hypothetical protein